ncbi:MAG: CPBP family intramembrane metalloprotease [Chloroflexi bacterium]|nr:CPBP family intramembrane metalloprotease [Chloroflexota bacterium]
MSSQVSTLRSPEMGNALSQRLWNWKDVALMSIASLLGVIVGAVVLFFVTMPANAGTTSGLTAAYMLSLVAVQAVVMLASVWGLGLLRRKASWATIGWRPVSTKWILAALGLFVLLRVVVTVLGLLLQSVGIHSQQAMALAPEGFTWASAIGSLVLTGVLGPISEEVFFRGVLYRWLRDRWGVAVGLVVSSVIFGLFHVELATVIPAIVIGLVCAFAYERSKSLVPAIVIHSANNLFAILMLYGFLAAGGTL